MTTKKFSPIAENLLTERYLKAGETAEDMFLRVADWISQTELKDKEKWKKKFFDIMNNMDFLPNSPCLMNAGTSMPQLAACFVYPIEDNMESIFDTLKYAALTHKSGGGTGFSFSKLRPRGDKVGMTGGITSGPVSFIEVYDKATQAIRQGGRRRGANMGLFRVDHPDIEEFIDAKQSENKLNNFNISVAMTDEFMEAVKNNTDYNLVFPANGAIRRKQKASIIFDKICKGAWKNGEPGVIFIDKVNRDNPLLKLGEIEATNPCAEQPLLPYEACVLGSINLSNHIKDNNIDWNKLENTVRIAVRFLDDAIDVSDFPFKEVDEIVKKNRKIGLGVMGFASMLMKLDIPYAGVEAIKTASQIMKFITETAHKISEELAVEKGEFANFYKSNLKKKRRNALLTTIAPTGSISLIAGTSSGIEPLYSLIIERRSEDGKYFRIIDKVFIEKLKENNLDIDAFIEKIQTKGGIKNIENLTEKLKNIFLTATEIEPRYHILMQAAFQRYVDNAISKTINLPEDYTVCGLKDIIFRAYRLGCKGITVYRQQSRRQQVLNLANSCESGKGECVV